MEISIKRSLISKRRDNYYLNKKYGISSFKYIHIIHNITPASKDKHQTAKFSTRFFVVALLYI